jgi:hypothetical protein
LASQLDQPASEVITMELELPTAELIIREAGAVGGTTRLHHCSLIDPRDAQRAAFLCMSMPHELTDAFVVIERGGLPGEPSGWGGFGRVRKTGPYFTGHKWLEVGKIS